jgi:hypothetical protein
VASAPTGPSARTRSAYCSSSAITWRASSTIGRRDAERQHDRIAAFLEGVSVPKQQRRVA